MSAMLAAYTAALSTKNGFLRNRTDGEMLFSPARLGAASAAEELPLAAFPSAEEDGTLDSIFLSNSTGLTCAWLAGAEEIARRIVAPKKCRKFTETHSDCSGTAPTEFANALPLIRG